MSQHDTIGSFAQENFKLFKKWLQARLNIQQLRLVRSIARITGAFAWLIVSFLLGFLVVLFLGIMAACWIATYTHSYVTGFAIVAGVFMFTGLLLTMFRKKIFVGGMIRFLANQILNNDISNESETPS